MSMETCMSIVAMDHANSGEEEPMGSQIYETFLHTEVTDVSVMMPNTVEHYELEMWEGLEELQAVFGALASTSVLVMVSTITPSDRLGTTFQFNTERIRSIAQLHELSIPGRISGDRHSTRQLDAINRVTSLPGSTDRLGNYNILDQDAQGGATMLVHKNRADGDITWI